MNVIIYNNGNGVSVVFPTGELSLDEIKKRDCPENSIVIDDADLPSRDFRNAWEIVEGKVKVNFFKAKDLTKNKLRAERKFLLEAQDVAFQRALENGSDTSSIVNEKERLRNITNLVDACNSIDELKNIKID
jgi:hypothetical protein